MANALLVQFWKIKNIAKCNIVGLLKNIPIIDRENIGKKKPMPRPPCPVAMNDDDDEWWRKKVSLILLKLGTHVGQSI